MFDLNVLFWILPLPLIVVFIYRYKSNSFPKGSIANPLNNQKSKTQKYRMVLLFILLCIIVCVGIKKTSISFLQPSCPTDISPSELASMINENDDFRAGIFTKHNYGLVHVIFTNDKDEEVTLYKYFPKKSIWLHSDGTIDEINSDDVEEFCVTEKDQKADLKYFVKNFDNYDGFFTYLKKNGGIQWVSQQKNLEYSTFEKYRLNNVIFIKKKFSLENDANEIYVVNIDSL